MCLPPHRRWRRFGVARAGRSIGARAASNSVPAWVRTAPTGAPAREAGRDRSDVPRSWPCAACCRPVRQPGLCRRRRPESRGRRRHSGRGQSHGPGCHTREKSAGSGFSRKPPGKGASPMNGTSKAPQFALHMRWNPRLPALVPTPRARGLQVVLHHPVERCLGGATAAVESGDASLQLDGHVRGGVRDGIVLLIRLNVLPFPPKTSSACCRSRRRMGSVSFTLYRGFSSVAGDCPKRPKAAPRPRPLPSRRLLTQPSRPADPRLRRCSALRPLRWPAHAPQRLHGHPIPMTLRHRAACARARPG